MKLDLRGNDIQELPTGAFKHTPYLTHLSLQRCNIRRVKEGAFRGLGRLVFLNLANNNIEILYQVVTMHIISPMRLQKKFMQHDLNKSPVFVSCNCRSHLMVCPHSSSL